MPWEPKTRGGYAVRIFAEDGRNGRTILGAVDVGNGWTVCEWRKPGGEALTRQVMPGDLDLVAPPEPVAVPDAVMAAAAPHLEGVSEEALRAALSAALTAYEKAGFGGK